MGGLLRMGHFKKESIIATSVLIGAFAVGGTGYAVSKTVSNHKEAVAGAKQGIKYEESSLKSIRSSVSKMSDKDGYLTSTASIAKLKGYQKKINRMSDSHTDFHIKKDDLKNPISVVKLDKKSVSKKVTAMERKVTIQDKVNSLFESKAINGKKVSKPAIKDRLTKDQVKSINEKYVNTHKENSKWFASIKSSVNEANAQLKQIDNAKKEVEKVYKNNKVVKGVSRSKYNSAKKQVDKIKNESVKKDLNSKLGKVLKEVKSNEDKARKEAEKKARVQSANTSQGSAKSTQSSNGQSTPSNSNSGVSSSSNGVSSSSDTSTGSSNGGSSSYSSGSSNSYNGGGSSSSNYSGSSSPSSHSSNGGSTNHYSGSTNHSSGSTSHSSGSSSHYSGSTSHSSGSANHSSGSTNHYSGSTNHSSSSNHSSGGSSSGYNKSNGGSKSTYGHKDGGGEIKGVGNTYETGTFNWDSVE